MDDWWGSSKSREINLLWTRTRSILIQLKVIEGPNYSIVGKHETKQISLSPGPGNYNDESFSTIYRKPSIYTLGMKHYTSAKELLPRPGQYDLNSSFVSNNSIKFPTQQRLTSLEGGMSPGPGCTIIINFEYNIDKAVSWQWKNITSLDDWNIFKITRIKEISSNSRSRSLLNDCYAQPVKNFTMKQKLQSKNSKFICSRTWCL
ncbi:unnamed protein product [Paramecium octaurelia]|uniref:Uncharacterized protein n=1 Tax=Paramecium octaurelia TaxID=43137 RepID=A0A8S1UAJ4_PAROT|nr:unnamed protein product [Paramecium octaurelia]